MKLLLILTFLIGTGTAFSNTYSVNQTGDSGTGTLREAIGLANSNFGVDTITFDASTDLAAITITSGYLYLTDSLVILGNGRQTTLIQGVSAQNIFELQYYVKLTLKNLNVSVGDYGIHTETGVGSIDVINCDFHEFDQPAIQYESTLGSLFVDKCNIYNCYLGIAIPYSLNVTISNSSFHDILNWGLTLDNSPDGDAQIFSNTFYQNSGGVYTMDPQAGNSILIVNNTVINNTDTGIHIVETNDNGGAVTLANNILYGNTTYDFSLYQFYPPGGANPLNYKNIVGTQNSDHGTITWYSTSDPMMSASGLEYQNGPTMVLPLTASSTMAINHADISFAPVLDQRGFSRVGSPDIGAAEYCTNTNGTISVDECVGYWSPSGQHYWTTSGVYNDVIPNSGGCDSLITINLTINQVDVAVTYFGHQLIVAESGAGVFYQWYDCSTNTMIPGATSQNYGPTVNGLYSCNVYDNGCMVMSDCIYVGDLAVKELTASTIKAYPNPTASVVNIDLGTDFDNAQLIVSDLFGKKICTRAVLSQLEMIDLPQSAGVYFISVVHSSGLIETVRVVKE